MWFGLKMATCANAYRIAFSSGHMMSLKFQKKSVSMLRNILLWWCFFLLILVGYVDTTFA